MTRAFVAGVAVRGPGLDGWPVARAVLAGTEPWADAAVCVPPPALLAANERRRAGLPVRLALAVAEEAVRMACLPLDAVRGVFGSANGEGAILHSLLETLAGDAPAVSPTLFHNSVHNAVAGYWAMGAGSRQPMTCLGAHADTFAATLLKALAEVAAEQAPVLLCAYDVPMPEPLARKQPTGCAFAVALVLTPAPAPGALAALRATWHPNPGHPNPGHPNPGQPNPGQPNPGHSGPSHSGPPPAAALPREANALDALGRQNPAARSLPLLRALAAARAAHLAFPLLDGALLVEMEPC